MTSTHPTHHERHPEDPAVLAATYFNPSPEFMFVWFGVLT